MNKLITFVCLFVAFILIGNFYFLKPNTFSIKMGVVESSSLLSTGIRGESIETALVRIPDGTIIQAQVKSGGPLKPGDEVTLSPRPIFFGSIQYEIYSKKQ
jgi:hypothetical protein